MPSGSIPLDDVNRILDLGLIMQFYFLLLKAFICILKILVKVVLFVLRFGHQQSSFLYSKRSLVLPIGLSSW
jgi:hypothetical protein